MRISGRKHPGSLPGLRPNRKKLAEHPTNMVIPPCLSKRDKAVIHSVSSSVRQSASRRTAWKTNISGSDGESHTTGCAECDEPTDEKQGLLQVMVFEFSDDSTIRSSYIGNYFDPDCDVHMTSGFLRNEYWNWNQK
ncbi:hypothetical protein Y032_0003g1269 [Ancylostoma ceylanicum]|uniref:Uncharacterized protein n=1 Tax=Ancylostoma ceylanicum TaxID=53326 RepID=A0A016VXT3_9BILA|nr:hypothetical protein Y032_0003g1269 [Ancylostoma ceylanicum]